MVLLTRPFVYGIGFASATWIISIYLYTQLTNMVSFNSTPSQLQLKENRQTFNQKNDIFNNQFHKKYVRKNKKYNDKSYLEKNSGKNSYLRKDSRDNIKNGFNRPVLVEKLHAISRTGSERNKSKGYEDELMELGIIKTPKEQEIRDEGFKVHAYNVLISHKLSYHREIPDTRHSLCKNEKFDTDTLPNASIIICFYNEYNDTLLRSVHSILERTPKNLLHEIILIDDCSDLPRLHKDVEQYLREKSLYKVKLFKNEKREGLIRSRIFGARKATGQVLLFLDSHIEVNVNWIEPLLARIKEKRSNVVMPVIDIINPDTFSYTSSPLVRGGFNWGLHFKWDKLARGTLNKSEDFIKPIKSPTMAGGLFAIDRKYFIDMGEYDAGMNIWGGENLEISFRIWMCGGSLELIPCSRVGHIFRHRRPYGSPDGQDTMLYNTLRMAHVWLDDYKEYFLKQNPNANNFDYGDISSRIQLKKELNCKNFDWYLKHVYPEQTLPNADPSNQKNKWTVLERDKFQPWQSRKRNYIDQFQIRLSNSSLCVQSENLKTKGSGLILRPCSRQRNQMWFETDKHELVLGKLFCLQASKPLPVLYKCHELGSDQEWRHQGGKNSPIYNLGAGTCLAAKEQSINATITMKLCTETTLINWDFVGEI